MLIPKIGSMREKILSPRIIFKDGEPLWLDEELASGMNCYAYAISCFYQMEQNIDNYAPGFTQNSHFKGRDDFVEKIQEDLENLKLRFRLIPIHSLTKDVNKNEYLVKAFLSEDAKSEERPAGDFHFIRQDPDSKLWFHKIGWYDEENKKGTQPGLVVGSDGFERIIGKELDAFVAKDEKGNFCQYVGMTYIAIEFA